MTVPRNRYNQLITEVFFDNYEEGSATVEVEREELAAAAERLGITNVRNPGDLIYSFRYRASLPPEVRAKAPKGTEWVILPVGRSKYRFEARSSKSIYLTPNELLTETKVPDSTPGIIASNALSDEQALLAKVRYNRLIDVFLGIAAYSLQSHLRTTVRGMGQVETDEIYVGLDHRGAHYVVPVQAKGGTDRLSTVQIEQDFALCKQKFPELVCRPVATQFMTSDLIAMFELEEAKTGVSIAVERHYRLVQPDEISLEELRSYKARADA